MGYRLPVLVCSECECECESGNICDCVAERSSMTEDRQMDILHFWTWIEGHASSSFCEGRVSLMGNVVWYVMLVRMRRWGSFRFAQEGV